MRILSSTRALNRSHTFENVLPEAVRCIAHAPVDFGKQVGIVVDILPEMDELIHFVVLRTGCL